MLFLGHMKKWSQKNNRYATIKKAGIAMALPFLKNRAQKKINGFNQIKTLSLLYNMITMGKTNLELTPIEDAALNRYLLLFRKYGRFVQPIASFS